MKRDRLTAKQREELWDAECAKSIAAGRGQYPICNICKTQITPGRRWHDSHNPYLPHALGGDRDGIAHERCNLKHNYEHDTPLVAKNKRQRQKFIGAWQTRSRPIPGTIRSGIRKPMNGGDPVWRDSGRPLHERRKG